VETAPTPELSDAKRALLERYLRRELPQTVIGTVAPQAPAPVEPASSASPRVPVVMLQRGGSKRPFFYLHVHWQGGPLYCFTLARALGADQPFYLLDPYRLDDLDAPPTIEVMAADYIQSLRSVQPEGPYQLGAFCGAGVIAYEMAQQLRAQGQAVELLVFFEPMAGPIQLSRLAGRVIRRIGKLTRLSPGSQLDWFLRIRFLLRLLRRAQDEFTEGYDKLLRRWRDAHPGHISFLPGADALRQDWLAVFAWPVSGYVPSPYPGKLTYLLARENRDSRVLWWGKPKASENVEIHIIPGDNETCRTVYAEALADALRRCVSAVPAGPSPNPAT
jgi:thioesterase superfamily protein